MDLKDQLKELFPDQVPSEDHETDHGYEDGLWIQEAPLLCKFERRHGKPTTIIEGYTGTKKDFKELTREIKTELGVGGSSKNNQIIIQGDYRALIMEILKDLGFKVKRVGG